jgi:16S rRNA (cytosine1402-N4)-methyltransferase
VTAGGHPGDGAAGGPARHTPVLLEEAMAHLAPSAGGLFIDATFGAGGYSRAILAAGGHVLAIDRDPTAIASGRALEEEAGGRLKLVEGRFSDLAAFAAWFGFAPADGVVMDVGVSSMQLDDPARGFSFREDGPLDMRMGPHGTDAAAVVNRASVKELAAIIGGLGEERKAGRIARAIDRARREAPIAGTARLAEIVAGAVGGPPARIHPATRTFQALRIFVNRELDELARGLSAAEEVLRAGGRLVVVAFHSLEDRIVKRFLQARARPARGSRHQPETVAVPPSFRLVTRGAVEPPAAEIAANPRARSARLRAAERTEAPAHALDMRAIGVPRLAGVPGPEAFA